MDQHTLKALLAGIADEYPAAMAPLQSSDVPRITFNISLALAAAGRRPPEALSICDIGGGVGLFSVGCAAAGFRRVILVDDFGDAINEDKGASILSLHRTHGVDVHTRDVMTQGVGDLCNGIDIVTCFDSMEHWNHSPKQLFRGLARDLRPGGAFVLGVPNCVNLRKRITVPLGRGKWSPMEEWYEAETFRAHVREPDVGDLKHIARDMGLVDVQIIGRNWLGHKSDSAWIRFATMVMDYPLRLRPSLCSDLYLVGRTPGTDY